MAVADYAPPYNCGAKPFTSTASATITGGTLVKVSGDGTVAPATTGDRPVGVAGHDAASGARVTTWPLSNVIHEVVIQGSVAITAGNDIVAGTTGFVNKGTLATDAAAGTFIGIALQTRTGDGAGGVTCRFQGA